jgi:hypothetical protein
LLQVPKSACVKRSKYECGEKRCFFLTTIGAFNIYTPRGKIISALPPLTKKKKKIKNINKFKIKQKKNINFMK